MGVTVLIEKKEKKEVFVCLLIVSSISLVAFNTYS